VNKKNNMGILRVDSRPEERRVLPKKPSQNPTPVMPDLSDQLFADYSGYSLTPDWEEAFLTATNPDQDMVLENTAEPTMLSMMDIPEGAVINQDEALIRTPEPMMTEESVWNFSVEVTTTPTPPPEASVIAENPVKNEAEDFWGFSSLNASASIVEGLSLDMGGNYTESDTVAEVDSIFNMDLVQYAIGESGLEGFLAPKVEEDTSIVKTEQSAPPSSLLQPEATSSNFLHTIDPATISVILPKTEARLVMEKPGGEGLKRKAGRPERQTPIQITEVPKISGLTEDELRSLKYRRSRDLNNEASKRCRKNRKEKQQEKERQVDEMKERNRELTMMLQQKEAEVDAWKERCRAVGYFC